MRRFTTGLELAAGGSSRLGRPKQLLDDLADLQGDKAVWKLLESGRYPVTEAAIDGPVPIDVDTWADYERLLEST